MKPIGEPRGEGRTASLPHISAYLSALILAVALITPQEAQEAAHGLAAYNHPVAPAPVLSQDDRTPTDIKEYAAYAADKEGLPPTLIQNLIRCESEWKLDALGDNGASQGLLQFKVPTFDLFSKKYGLEYYDIENPYHQIDLAALMISDGYINHWKNCGKKLGLIK